MLPCEMNFLNVYSMGEYKIRPYEINPTGRNDDQGHIFFVGNRLNGLSQMRESNIIV